MARPGVLGGQEPPKNSLSPPSALEFLKIFVHCRHSRNLLVMLLESAITFQANLKGVARKNFARFVRRRHRGANHCSKSRTLSKIITF